MNERRSQFNADELGADPDMITGPVAIDFDTLTLSWPTRELGRKSHEVVRGIYRALRDRLAGFEGGGFDCGGYSHDERRRIEMVIMTADAGYGHQLLALVRVFLQSRRMPSGCELVLTPAYGRPIVIVPLAFENPS